MINSDQVNEVLFNFTQRCFIGESGKSKLNLKKETGFFDVLSHGELTQLKAHQLSENHRKLLHELLSQYIMFFEMNLDLPFPSDFLDGSNQNVLGCNFLNYICEHRWPFPQLLKKHSV